jgi:probable F420-dependent oxidoreductase
MPAIHIPQDAQTLPDYPRLAGLVDPGGYDRLWIGEVNDVDAVTAATLAAVETEQAQIAVFLNVFTRAPTTLAMTASTIARLAPGRTQIVLGVGSPMFVERWNGIPYHRLHSRLSDVLRFLRIALAGDRVREHFRTFDSDGFALASPPDPPPYLLIAAGGPRALDLAATEADGVVLNWITPSDVELIRPLPEDRHTVSLVVPVCPTTDREVMDQVMRPVVANYLRIPGYASQQRRLGRGAMLQHMWSAWSEGDAASARAALPFAVLDEFVVWGEPTACRTELSEIEHRTGVRVIATYFSPPGMIFGDLAFGRDLPPSSRRTGEGPDSSGEGEPRTSTS